jgi:hypothetical protein
MKHLAWVFALVPCVLVIGYFYSQKDNDESVPASSNVSSNSQFKDRLKRNHEQQQQVASKNSEFDQAVKEIEQARKIPEEKNVQMANSSAKQAAFYTDEVQRKMVGYSMNYRVEFCSKLLEEQGVKSKAIEQVFEIIERREADFIRNQMNFVKAGADRNIRHYQSEKDAIKFTSEAELKLLLGAEIHAKLQTLESSIRSEAIAKSKSKNND